MKDYKQQTHGTKLSLLSLAALAFATPQFIDAGVPAPSGDWYQIGGTGNWVLEDPLIGPSGSASSSPEAAFEVEPGLDASILDGGSWDLDLFDPAGIKFRESGTLTLDGDFTATVVNSDFPSLYNVGVLHTGEVGEIAGDGNITVTSESSLSNDPSIIVGGVILDSSGELVLADYSGDITVTNDNSGGSTITTPGEGLDVLGFVEIDSEKSAVAVGVGAIDLDDPLGSLLSGDTNIVGGLNQNVNVSASSRDSIAFVGDDDDDDDDANAIVGAIGVGIVGNVESNPEGSADVSVTATGSDATAIGEIDDAVAVTLGVALGVGGSVDGIQNATSISATSSSGAATSQANDYSNSTSLAASVGVLGLVGNIDGDEETVSITADATSGETDAGGFGTSTSLTGAIAVGLGGVVPGGVSSAEITSTATADNASAVSGEALSFAGAVAISSGIIGSVDGPLVDTTLTSEATAGNASAEGFSSVALSIGGALAGLGPIDGTFGESAVAATAATGNADADGVFGAIAATNSVAVGLGEFEDTFFALLESLAPIGQAFGDIGTILPLDSILPGELDILGDLIESAEEVLPSEGLAGTIDATSTSGNAVATLEPFPEFSDIVEGDDDDDDDLALASSGTLAIGQAGDVDGPVSANVTVSATSGNATADGLKRSSALAASGATAIGILGDIEFVEEIEIEDAVEGVPVEGAAALSGDVVATATAGDATATADNETSAIATALAEGTGDIDGNVTGSVTATATAGASTASSLFLDAYADSDADAYGTGDINGDVDAGVTIAATANGGVATATSELYADDDDDDDDQPVTGGYAEASSHADAYAVDGVFGEASVPTDAVESDILDEDLISVAGTFNATATSSTATATGYDGADADAQAHAYGVNADDSDIDANISATFTSIATSGAAIATNSGFLRGDDDDDDDDDAYADVDTRAAAIEDADDFYGSFTGSVTSTATAGVATATSSDGSAYADAEAFAHGVDHDGRGSKFVGDYSAATTVTATGGTATADSEDFRYGYASADADARIAALSDPERFEGDFTATVNGTSTAGTATATSTVEPSFGGYSYSDAYAYAGGDAYGVELYADDDDDDDDDSSYKGSFDASVTLTANGGTATANASFDQFAKDVIEGEPSDSIIDSNARAYAEAEVAAVAGAIDYEGDFGGTVNLTANGGTANSTAESINFEGPGAEADSDAYATAEGLGLDLTGGVFALIEEEIEFDDPTGAVFDADVTITSIGGTANSTAIADALGAIDDESVYGSANSDASARSVSVGAFALGDDDDDDDDDGLDYFEGSLEGTHTLMASGGTADSVGDDFANAAADAETAVLQFDSGDGNSLTGGIDAVATLTSTGGNSTASSDFGNAFASADAESSFIKNVADLTGDVAVTATIAASGGTAEADAGEDSRASADSDASFVDGNFGVLDGDVSGTVTVNATGTGAVAIARSTIFPFLDSPDDDDDTADASATASAQGIDDLETIDGEVSATFNLTAVGGEAYALITEAVTGDVVEGFNTLLLPSFEAYANASAEATVIDADVDGTVSSAITATVNNSTAKAYAQAPQGGYAGAYASAAATGIDGDVYENNADDALSGDITLSTTGGLAYAELLGDEFIGDVNDVVEGVFADDDDDDDDSGEAYAYASASSIGVDGDVDGDVSSTFTIDATGGTAVATSETIIGQQQVIPFGSFASLEADATAEAIALNGNLTGDFTGAITATATGGTAITEESVTGGDDIWVPAQGPDTVEGDGYSVVEGDIANASALAAGIGSGDSLLDGDVIGDITVTATGGTAASLYSNDFFLNNTDEIESDSLPTDLAIDAGNAAAGALAAGIYSNVESSEVSGLIQATATGGTATYQEGGLAMRPPTYPGPDTDTIEGEAVMLFRSGSTAGALAAGILGRSIEIGDVGSGESGEGGIIATATAGDVIFGGGIRGGPVSGDTIEGGAVEVPIPPSIPEIPSIPGGFSTPAAAFAAGIMSYDLGIPSIDIDSPVDFVGDDPVSASSLIDVSISTFVHAFVTGGVTSEEYLRSGAPSYAAAVYGAQGDDMIELAEGADIIGDINLGGGANTLTVTGNSIMEGDILSTALESIGFWLGIDNGAGTVDFDIDSGLFTAVRTVNVSDLADAIEIAATGGLAPILSQNQELELPEDLVQTSLINVTGDGSTDVNIAAGATVMPVFDDSVVLDGLVGQTYALITADGTIADAGAIADGSMTPYNFTTFYESDERDTFGITIDSIRVLDEEETPGTVQTSDAVTTATQAVMLDMSKHASLLRSLLRRNVVSTGAAPIGAAGPDAETAAMERGYRTGEWLGYTSVFGNIGQQDSEGGFAGFDYDTYGFTVGFEKLFGEQLIIGVAGTYADTDIDGMDGSGGGDSELYAGAVYANWFSETWFVEGGLTYGVADNDVIRIGATDLLGTPGAFRGGNDSEMVGGWAEVGYTFRDDAFSYEPYARVTYIHGDHDGYTESAVGGPNPVFEQIVDDDQTENLKTELGIRIAHEWYLDNSGSFVLEGKVGWEHEWADNNVKVDTTYLGDPFELQSAESDEDAVVLGIRAEWQNGEGLALGLEYEPTLSGNWYNHTFSGTIQYNW